LAWLDITGCRHAKDIVAVPQKHADTHSKPSLTAV
jgi:hypothetical protein